MNTQRIQPTYVAFYADSVLRSGPLTEVLAAIKLTAADAPAGSVLIFENATGDQVDFDMRGSLDDVLERVRSAKPAAGPGRPKLGVESREVGLLPRHWEWLQKQPSGASATLRKLVEEHMRRNAPEQESRAARDAVYKIMSAVAGNRANFEEAARALYAGDPARFSELIAAWPSDLQAHFKQMLALN